MDRDNLEAAYARIESLENEIKQLKKQLVSSSPKINQDGKLITFTPKDWIILFQCASSYKYRMYVDDKGDHLIDTDSVYWQDGTIYFETERK